MHMPLPKIPYNLHASSQLAWESLAFCLPAGLPDSTDNGLEFPVPALRNKTLPCSVYFG